VLPIALFLVSHWVLAVFCQTFFLHRYGAHQMFSMSKGWERFFYLLTFTAQGSSYLNPRAYAILHREHHAFSDTPRDPHSPHVYPNLITMMKHTLDRYQEHSHRRIEAESRFDTGAPEWPLLDKIGRSWACHLAFMAGYTAFYVAFLGVAWEELQHLAAYPQFRRRGRGLYYYARSGARFLAEPIDANPRALRAAGLSEDAIERAHAVLEAALPELAMMLMHAEAMRVGLRVQTREVVTG
jgi:hypothetical protein